MRLGEVHDLTGEVLVVVSIIEESRRESLSMALQRMGLLDLAAVWKTDILNAEVVLGIVSVG